MGRIGTYVHHHCYCQEGWKKSNEKAGLK